MMAERNRAGSWGMIAAFALAGTVGAQTRPGTMPTAPVVAAAAAAHSDSAEAHARLSEIKVGIAWLADPATFACTLKLRTLRSAMLEVSGTVPSGEARAKTLEIARAHSELSVVDALTVGRVSLPKHKSESATQLNLEATKALGEKAFQAIQNLEIQAHPDGQITLLGSISSHEEKLLVSLRLRRIAGCTCVDNRLSIRPRLEAGASCCAVTADGRLLVRAEKTEPASTPVVSAEPTAPKPPMPVPKSNPAPVKIVPVSARVKPATAAHVDPAVTRAVFQIKPADGFVVKPVAASLDAPSNMGTTTALEPTKLPIMKGALPVGGAESGTASTSVKAPGNTDTPRVAALAEPRPVESASARVAARAEVAEMPCIVATPAGIEFRSGSGPRPAEVQTVSAVVARPVEAKPAVAESRPEAAAAPGPNNTSPAASAEDPAPGSLADWYRNRIAQECGLDVDCVSVTFPTHTDIAVMLRIAERATAGRLCTKVSRIPELAPYHVKIEVETTPH